MHIRLNNKSANHQLEKYVFETRPDNDEVWSDIYFNNFDDLPTYSIVEVKTMHTCSNLAISDDEFFEK